MAAIGAVGVATATPGEGTVGTLNRGVNTDEVKVHTDEIELKTQGPTDVRAGSFSSLRPSFAMSA